MPQVKYLGKSPSQFLTHVNAKPDLKELADDTGKWRSPVPSSAIIRQIKNYTNSTSRPTSSGFRLALDYTYRRFLLKTSVCMLHLNDVFQQDLDIWSRSPGLPWCDLGYRTMDDIRRDPEAIRKVRLFWRRVKIGDRMAFPDCMGLVHKHVCEVGMTEEVRTAWEYPATVTFGEAVFALPLIRAYKNMPNAPIAYGYETDIDGMRRVRNKFVDDKYLVALDYSGFDQTVPAWLTHIAFDMLRGNVDFCHYQDHGIADARRMYRMFDAIEEYFTHTKIRLAYGYRFQKHSGVASGSYFTQLVDAIVNCIVISWLSYEQFGHAPANDLYLGDNSLIGCKERWDLDVCQQLVESIGMKINFSKSVVTSDLDNVTFLGYKVGTP